MDDQEAAAAEASLSEMDDQEIAALQTYVAGRAGGCAEAAQQRPAGVPLAHPGQPDARVLVRRSSVLAA